MGARSGSSSNLPRIVGGKFRLLETRPSDADTACFLAEHMGIHRQVELKTLAEGVPFPSTGSDRLLREARTTGSVSHPGVQSVVDSGTDERGRPYVVYEALKGSTVAQLLSESPAGIAPLRAARIALSAAEAVRALHRAGVVARALGPSDVFVLGTQEDEEPVKIRSLSGAAFLAEEPPPDPLPPTPWLAPEIRAGSPGLDPRVDVYSLGVLLRHLLTGRTSSARPLPDTARRVIDQATRAAPDERFPDLDALAQALALLTPSGDRPARDDMPTPEDPLAADLQYLSLRRSTRDGAPALGRGEARVHLLPVLLAIEAIYRRLGTESWMKLATEVPGVDDLLPGSGKTDALVASGVPIDLFSRILATADALAGRGDLALLTEIGETVAHRGLSRLLPDLPAPPTADVLVDRFPYVWSRITLQGKAVVLERKPGAARLGVQGQGEPSLEVSGFFAGLFRAALRNTGVRRSEVVMTGCQALGDPSDVFGVTWAAG